MSGVKVHPIPGLLPGEANSEDVNCLLVLTVLEEDNKAPSFRLKIIVKLE